MTAIGVMTNVYDILPTPFSTARDALNLAAMTSNAVGMHMPSAISTAGSHQRNLARVNAIKQGVNNFIHGSGPARTKMITEVVSSAIYGGALGAGTVGVGKLGVRVATNKPTMFSRGNAEIGKEVAPKMNKPGTYRVERELPRNEHGLPIPDVTRPHSQIGKVSSDRGYTYTQAREWGYDVNGRLIPTRDIDFTDHHRPSIHPNPHQHKYIPNSTGGTMQRSKLAEPLDIPNYSYDVTIDHTNVTNKF